ncbi:unnamed protein product, partial [Brassica oleracea var. botrytis]
KSLSVPIFEVVPHPIFLDAGEAFGRRRRVLCSTSCSLPSAASYIVVFSLCVIVIFNIAIPSVLSVATTSGRCLSSPSSDFGSGNLWNSGLRLTSPRSSPRSVLYSPPKASMKTSLFEDSLRWAHVPTPQPHRTSTAPDELVTGNHVFPLSYCRIDHVPWWVMYSSLLLQTVSTVSPFDPSLVGPFIDSNAGSSEDGFVSSPSRPVVSTQGSDEYNRLPVGVPSSSRGGVRGPSFPSDLNLIFWASSSIWAFPDVLGLNLNISYIDKCLHHQCSIRQFPPTYSSILVFSVPKTIMYSERKISSTILPSRSPNSVITGSIEIHLVSRINIVGGRADISGRYPKVFSCGLLPRFPPYVSISSFIVSNSIMELEMMLDPSRSPYVSLKMLSTMYKIQIIFSEITDGDTVVCLLDYLSSSSCTSVQTHSLGCINVVYDYSKLVGAFNSGIKVKIIQGFLHIEQASPTNIISSVLMYSLLFILSSTMAPVVTT